MKPARKTRDFSIESILADKRVNEKSCVRTECHVTNSRYFKEYTNVSESANFRSEEEKYERNSEPSKDNFECENKLICDTIDKNISESFEESKSNTTEIITNECEINSNIFEHGNETEKHESNYCKMSSRDQEGQLNEERKSEEDQSDQLCDSSKYLNCAFETESKYSSFKNEKNTEFSRSKIGTPEVLRDIEKLEWLQCTRYKPPKIPRKAIGKNKRKPSFYPRIPFSMFQLEFLEQKFQNSAYLTRNDVTDISDILKLPPNRIKIWFQNRRARERREFCTNV